MFAYCGNNPVTGYDPIGFYDRKTLGQQIKTIAIGFDTGGGGGGVVVAASVFLAPLVYSGVNGTADFLGDLADDVSDVVNILKRYGKYKCKEAAAALEKMLLDSNTRSNLITIQYRGGRGYIWSNSKQDVISENGFHCGTEINGIVYCNIHPYGLPVQDWLSDFEATGERHVLRIPLVG